MTLTVGGKVPAFDLESTIGGRVSLQSLRGERFVLFFYPRDNTPGCTREACDFQDKYDQLKRKGVRVYGVSKDSIRSHEGFRQKFELTFPLLSDPDNVVGKAYGAFGQKKMYGKAVVGTIRSTFLISGDGKLEAVWSPVKVDGHVDAVLATIKGEPAKVAPKGKAVPARAASKKPSKPARR